MSSHLSKLSIQRLSAYGRSKGCRSPLLTAFVCYTVSVVRCGLREKIDQHVKTEITKLIQSSSVPGAALYFGVAAGRFFEDQTLLDYRFVKIEWLIQACVHGSILSDSSYQLLGLPEYGSQRLEFMGDAVIDRITTDYLYALRVNGRTSFSW